MSAWVAKRFQFDGGNPSLLELSDVMFRPIARDEVVELRGVAEAEDNGRVFFFRDFLEEVIGSVPGSSESERRIFCFG